MTEFYMRLLTDVELSDKQKHVWYRCVEKFLDPDESAAPEDFIDQFTAQRDELEGDEDFPFVYVVYLNQELDMAQAENIVELWSEIYPRDFEIETSADIECCDDCEEFEMDDAMYEEIQNRASKFLHNRWVESQIQSGWRYGSRSDLQEKVSPTLRDWDSLNEQYRKYVPLTETQAEEFFKKYPHLFV